MLHSTKRIWQCDVCGKQGKWSGQWRSKLILHGRSRGPIWDEEITVCSDACAHQFDKRKKTKSA